VIAWASGFFPSNRIGAELRETSTGGASRSVQPDGKASGNITWKSAQDGDDELLWLHKNQENVAPEQRYVLPNRELVLAPKEELLGVYPTSPPTGLLGVGLGGDSSPRMIAFQARLEF
jgi:hypothetical protein